MIVGIRSNICCRPSSEVFQAVNASEFLLRRPSLLRAQLFLGIILHVGLMHRLH